MIEHVVNNISDNVSEWSHVVIDLFTVQSYNESWCTCLCGATLLRHGMYLFTAMTSVHVAPQTDCLSGIDNHRCHERETSIADPHC